MKDADKFLEWYRKQFNTIVEQPPNEVWNNISKELDINDVWTKVDSKLNSIERRKILIRRSVYVSLFLLLFLIPGSIILKTFNNKKRLQPNPSLISSNAGKGNDQSSSLQSDELHTSSFPYENGRDASNAPTLLADKIDKSSSIGTVSSSIIDEPNQKAKELNKHFNSGEEDVVKEAGKNNSNSSFSQVKIEVVAKQPAENFIAPENSILSSLNSANAFPINANDSNIKEEFLNASMPYLLVS